MTKQVMDTHLSAQGALGPSLCRGGMCVPTVPFEWFYMVKNWSKKHHICAECERLMLNMHANTLADYENPIYDGPQPRTPAPVQPLQNLNTEGDE